MSSLSSGPPVLVFNARPKAVPGDLRISWRLSMTLLALYHSRGRRASFHKLHILNGALRFRTARTRLVQFLRGSREVETCVIRVEPAFSRSLDLLVGKGLAARVIKSHKLSIQITPQGIEAARVIDANEDVFRDEKEFLASTGRQVTESVVQSIVQAGKRWPV